MAHKHLNAREWLESQHLQGCEWAPELLELVDGLGEQEEMEAALGDIRRKAPDLVNGSRLKLHEHERIANWTCERLDLLESLEEIISENLDGMTWPNGTVPIEVDDKLRAAFDSERWLTYDL